MKFDLAAQVGAGLRVIDVPPGVHDVRESVILPRPILVRGLGDFCRLRLLNGASIIPTSSHTEIDRLRIDALTGAPAIQTPAGPGGGIYSLTISRSTIKGQHCIRLYDVVLARIVDCEIFVTDGGVGLDVDGEFAGVEGHPNADDRGDTIRSQHTRYGGERGGSDTLVRLSGLAHAKFFGGDFNFGGVGIEIRRGKVHEPKFVQLIGCGFENGSAEALKIEGGRMLRIVDLYASHDSEGRHSVVYFGRGFQGEAFFTQPQIRGGARDGLRAVSGGLISIVGGQIGNNGRKVTGDGLRVLPGVRKLVTSGLALEPFSDGNGALQRHAAKVEAGEWVR